MSENRLSDILHRMHDRLIFRFDPPGDRAYYLEVIDTAEAGCGQKLPQSVAGQRRGARPVRSGGIPAKPVDF